MHEYFCTDINGDTIFSRPGQADRMNFLLQEFSGGRPSINRDLDFAFPKKMEATYNNYNLKIFPTYSGCKVALRVDQSFLADNTTVYDPIVPFPADFEINVLIIKKNSAADSYTNAVVNRPVQSRYFFTNENTFSAKAFPFLTAGISLFDPTGKYQQGDLANFGSGDTRIFYKDDSGDHWVSVVRDQFANSNDQLLSTTKFYYTFDPASVIKDATFILKDKNGIVLKTITAHNDDFISKTLIDLSGLGGEILHDVFKFPDAVYTLGVTASGGYAASHSLVFNDDFYDNSQWALIKIKPAVTNTAFNLFATDGHLIKRKSASGSWTQAPIFEIPVKSRYTFWRYKNLKGKELKLDPSLTSYLFKEDKDLLSLQPRSISNSYFKLPKQGSTDTKYFPGPVNLAIAKDVKDRICFDVMVPESDLFPVVP